MSQQTYRDLPANKEVRVCFAVVLGGCLILSMAPLLWPAYEPARSFAMSAPYWQTIVQLLIVAAAVMTMVLGMVHYHVRRNVSVLALVFGIFLAGIVELFHLMIVDGWVIGGTNRDAVPVSWLFTRFGRAILLNLFCIAFLLSVKDRLVISLRTVWGSLLAATCAITIVGFFALFFIGAGKGLPDMINEAAFIKRPWELFALAFYLLAAVLVFPMYYARFPSRTMLGLMLSSVPDLFAQLHVAFGAAAIFDHHASTAIIFKLIAYLLPLIGMIMDYYRSYEEEADAVRKFREAEQRLKNRLMDVQHSSARYEQEEADRQSAEEAIRVLDRAIAASSCGIIITDPKVPGNQIIYVNPSFERITGYPAEEAIGRGLDFLYAQDQEQPAAQEVSAAISDARECRVIIRNYTRTGRMFWSELDIAPVPDDNGMLSHYIGIMTDITDRVRAEDEHKKFTAKLEHTNRELADFVHVASHDLQEPLRKVQVFGDRLRAKCQNSIPEEGLLYLERMRNSVVRMDRLIRDLLTYSRIGRKEQEFTMVDMNAVAREVLSDLEVRIEETHGVVHVDTLPTLEADATQMRQLLQNLIGNALKFHRPDVPPEVWLHAEFITLDIDSQPIPHVRFFVRDNGIGFDEKYIERIFTVFQRLHTGNHYEGTGLGLTVCRKIAERHSGSIAASSSPAEGATFFVTLPIKRMVVS